MIALVLCIAAFGLCLWAGRRSLGQGLLVLLTFGYFYGILRANLLTTFSHFIFDAGALGLYLSQNWLASEPGRHSEAIRLWTLVLIGWCLLLVLLPFQPLLISLVGFRGNVLFLPMLILGTRLKDKDLTALGTGFAVLNLLAALFAWAEYFTSVTRFYPLSPVTQIIYSSADVAGGFYRIPATFSSAHAYGGMMVASLPYLIGCWDHVKSRFLRALILLGGIAALLGVLMSATRSNFILGVVLVLAALFTRRAKPGALVAFALLIAILGSVAMTNERFQRFKSLSDTEGVVDRIAGSVNRGFWEILVEYPMGNGLGGGGTSMPYFLAAEVRNPIQMENEYARILCEQGIIGVLLWIGFVLWFMTRVRVAFQGGPWTNSRRMVWCLAAFSLGTAWIGLGMLTAIPQTVILLLGMGWTATPQGNDARATTEVRARPGRFEARYVPAIR
jgi:hypothetical protein